LRKPEVARKCRESSGTRLSTGRVGKRGKVAGGQLDLAQREVAAFGRESTQPPHGCALVLTWLVLKHQQADRKRVVERYAWEFRGRRANGG
jgi:hypothetical protein